MRVWRVQERSDVLWCVCAAQQKYPAFDAYAALAWGLAMSASDCVAIWRTEDAFLIATVSQRFYLPEENRCDVLFLCSARDDGRSAASLMALVRTVRDWAVEKGCASLDLGCETDEDLGPLARRIGPSWRRLSYVIPLSRDSALSEPRDLGEEFYKWANTAWRV